MVLSMMEENGERGQERMNGMRITKILHHSGQVDNTTESPYKRRKTKFSCWVLEKGWRERNCHFNYWPYQISVRDMKVKLGLDCQFVRISDKPAGSGDEATGIWSVYLSLCYEKGVQY